MRKRHALIIREAILDVRWDWDMDNAFPRTPNFQCKGQREFDLYLKAYNRELHRLSQREIEKTYQKIRERASLSKL